MSWYISEIVIYGKNGQIRSVSLRPGVNIITGDSRTGKSSLIHLVDYCLGASECEITERVIREIVSHYGVENSTPREQLFIVRKEPGGQTFTHGMFSHMAAQLGLRNLALG